MTGSQDLSSKVAAYKTKLDDYHKANVAYLTSLNGTNFVTKTDKTISNLTANTTTTQNNVEACKAVCSTASATCKGATFNSSSKSCKTFNSYISPANIIDSIGNTAIIPEPLEKLLVVQRLNDELIAQAKELITAIEDANDANNETRIQKTTSLTDDYNKLLEERSSIEKQIQEYKGKGDIVESSGLVVNQKYYSYLGLLLIAVVFVLLFMLIVFSSSSSSSNSSPYMLTSQRGGGGGSGKLSNNTYYLIFGIIIMTSLFFQVK
jgi:tetrahydromethanopterin S-methyltransferase subunit B